MLDNLASLLVRRRWMLALISFLIASAVIYGAIFLTTKSGYKIFFDKDNPLLIAHERKEQIYTKSDDITFAVEATGGNLFQKDVLLAVTTLTERAWLLPYSTRVDSLTNYQHTTVEGDELFVDDFYSADREYSKEELVTLREIAGDNPELVNNMLSNRKHASVVVTTLTYPDDDFERTTARNMSVDAAEKLAEDIRAEFPQVNVHLLGRSTVNYSFEQMAKRDMETLVPIMLLVITAFIWLLTKSINTTLSTLVIVILGTAIAQGFMGWVGYSINQVNGGVSIIVMTIGICNCIHIVKNYRSKLRQDTPKLEAMEKSLAANINPIFLTNLSTCIGFLSLNFSEVPPFREIGNIAAVGVISILVFSFTILPALLLLTNQKVKQGPSESPLVEKYCSYLFKNQQIFFWPFLILALSISSMAVLNELNDDVYKYFDRHIPVRAASEFLDNNITGLEALNYSIDSGKENGVTDPEFMRKIEEFAAWFESQPEAVHVNSYTRIIKRLNKNMHANDESYYKIPDNQSLAAQYLLLYEMSLPFGLDLNNQINLSKSSALVTVRITNATTNILLDIEKRADAWFDANAPELKTSPTGPSAMFAHIGRTNIQSMLVGSAIALFFVTLTLMIALRSVKYGLISIVPNAFPAMIAFGIWGLIYAEMDLGVAVIFTVTLGIVVDDTVHFMTKYLNGKNEHRMNSDDAIKYAFNQVGNALVTTTLIIVAGFLVLSFSEFKVNHTMGLLVGITVFIALIWDFVFLPLFIRLVDGDKELERSENEEQATEAEPA